MNFPWGSKRRLFVGFAVVGAFLIDVALKRFAYLNQELRFGEVIGWRYFENKGIIAGIPLPLEFTILFTVFIIGVFIYFADSTPSWRQRLAIVALLLGAISNLVDRIAFGFTIDYLLLYRSVFNIADILIATGLLSYLWYTKRTV